MTLKEAYKILGASKQDDTLTTTIAPEYFFAYNYE